MPEFADMLQEAYGSPSGKKIEDRYWDKFPAFKMPEEPLTMFIDPGSYKAQLLKDDAADAADALRYCLQQISPPPKRQSITPTSRLNPLLLLCN